MTKGRGMLTETEERGLHITIRYTDELEFADNGWPGTIIAEDGCGRKRQM